MSEKAKQVWYTPQEALMATGMRRGTFTNRALALGIPRRGKYTLDDIYRIASYEPRRIAPREERVTELRDSLTEMLEQSDSAYRIQQVDGESQLVRIR